MEKLVHPEFKFKGKREYIHGPDITNVILNFLRDNNIGFNKMQLSMVKMAHCHMDILFTDDIKRVNKNANSFFFVDSKDEMFYGHLVENGSKVEIRYEYPEELVSANAVIDVKREVITYKSEMIFSTIEIVVALNKALHEKLYPEAKGKWIYTKLDINHFFLQNPDSISIKLIKNMNLRLTQAEMFFEGNSVGYIYYSLV